jgi:hypothetical protein
MGSTGPKRRAAKKSLPKVPKYEEPNTFPGLGGGGAAMTGREGHSAGGHHTEPPGRAGRRFLRFLGLKPKGQPPG